VSVGLVWLGCLVINAFASPEMKTSFIPAITQTTLLLLEYIPYGMGTTVTLFIHFPPIKCGLQACVIFAILLCGSKPELIPVVKQVH